MHSRIRLAWWIGVIAATSSGAEVWAQGNTFNPFGNSGYADYREFTTPMYANDPSLPGQARLQGGFAASRSNQFNSYLNSLSGNEGERSFDRTSPSGVPYYQLPRTGSRDRATYRPNNTQADRAYQLQVKRREEAYFKAQNEKDPRKRAQMIQQIERSDVMRRTPSPAANPAARAVNGATGATTRRPPAAAAAPQPAAPTTSRTAVSPAPGTTTNSGEAVPPTNPESVPIPAPN